MVNRCFFNAEAASLNLRDQLDADRAALGGELYSIQALPPQQTKITVDIPELEAEQEFDQMLIGSSGQTAMKRIRRAAFCIRLQRRRRRLAWRPALAIPKCRIVRPRPYRKPLLSTHSEIRSRGLRHIQDSERAEQRAEVGAVFAGFQGPQKYYPCSVVDNNNLEIRRERSQNHHRPGN